MPVVPYSPNPQVAPSGQAIPTPRVGADPNAFGANLGAAVQDLGRVAAGASNEVWQRAVALQTLDNEAAAKNADTEYLLAAGKEQEQFNSLLGKNAVDDYPLYQVRLEKTRSTIREALPNPAVRKAFDASSKSVMVRAVFSGAGHSARQNKAYVVGSSEARVDALYSTVAANAGDDKAFDRTMSDIIDEIDQQGNVLGWGEDQINNTVSDKTSKLWAYRVKSLARTDPIAADEMLKANKDKIRGQDLDAVDQNVRLQTRQVIARQGTNAIVQGWAPYMDEKAIGRAKGIEQSLITVIQKAQNDNPDLQFTIAPEGGTRTVEQQRAIVARGASKTMNSNHLEIHGGRAVDLIPIVNGKMNPNAGPAEMAKIRAAMDKAAAELGIPLGKPIGWDPAHFDLPREYDVSKAPKPKELTEQDVVERTRRFSDRYAANDPLFPDFAESRARSQYKVEKSVRQDLEWRDQTTVAKALLGEEGKADTLPTTIEQLKAVSPEVATAWEALANKPDVQRKVLAQLEKNATADVPMTPERFETWRKLDGLAETDPAQFLTEDIMAADLPRAKKALLLEKQQKKKANAEMDPRVGRALQIMSPTLTSIGLTKAKDPQGFATFTGSMQELITQYTEEHKKQPDQKEIKEMGARLLRETPVGLWSRKYDPKGSGDKQLHMIEPPDDIKAKIKAKYPDRSDAQLQSLYTRALFQQLYGGTVSKPAAPSAPKPTAPTSR